MNADQSRWDSGAKPWQQAISTSQAARMPRANDASTQPEIEPGFYALHEVLPLIAQPVRHARSIELVHFFCSPELHLRERSSTLAAVQ